MYNLVLAFRIGKVKVGFLRYQEVNITSPMVIRNAEGIRTLFETEIAGIGAGVKAELALTDGREVPDAGELLHKLVHLGFVDFLETVHNLFLSARNPYKSGSAAIENILLDMGPGIW